MKTMVKLILATIVFATVFMSAENDKNDFDKPITMKACLSSCDPFP